MMNGPYNAIGWCDYTWNPITGCLHGCRFGPNKVVCYAETIAERFRGTTSFPKGFEPTYHPDRLRQPLRVKEPARIFTCSMADLFGSWVPDKWQREVLAIAREAHWHTFQFLTKAPWIARRVEFPDNAWVGSTITGGLKNEKKRHQDVARYRARVRFISAEPLEGPLLEEDLDVSRPDWIIIGAATGTGGYQPEEAWVARLEAWADRQGVPVFHKDNLTIRKRSRRQDFPAGQRQRPAPPRSTPSFRGRYLPLRSE